MKNDKLSTLIALVFFAGTFVIAFTSNDSDVAAMRVLAYLAVGCVLSMVSIFWDKITGTEKETTPSNINAVLYDAQKFSNEYGDVYVLADKMKKQRKGKEGNLVLPKHG